MRFHSNGMHPESAVNLALHLFDKNENNSEKVKSLISNKHIPPLKSKNKATSFKSGKTIDINLGELLGIGLIGAFYNWAGEKFGNTYQVVTGTDDSTKSSVESYLSDGGIYHEQTERRMLFQQVMVQGFKPKRAITTEMVVEQINRKAAKRSSYPEYCGLVVNLYSQDGEIDIDKIRHKSNHKKFNSIYLIFYGMPQLDSARVVYVNDIRAPKLDVKLTRHPIDEEWEFNFDRAKHYKSS